MNAGFAAGWRQVVICLLMMAAGAMVTSAFSVIAVPLSEEFRPSRMVLMLAMTLMALFAGALSPFFGAVMDRASLRLLMGIGAAMIAAGFVALSFATSFVQVLAVYALLMAPANILVGPMAATILLSRWFVKRRGTAIGIAVTGVSMGGFAYPPIAQALLDSFEWREAFRWLGLIIAATTLPAVLLAVNRPGDLGLHPDGAASAPEAQETAGEGAPFSLRGLLADPSFWILGATLGLVMAGMMGMATSLVPLALDEGIDAGAAALLISIYAGCGFVAKLIFAVVVDRMGPRNLLMVGVAGFAAGMACMIAADAGYWTIMLGVGLIGMFGGMMVPLQGLLVPRLFGAHVIGRVSGVIGILMLVGFLATPPLFGFIYDRTGNYDAVFMGFAIVAVGLLLLVPHLRVQPKPPAEAAAGLA